MQATPGLFMRAARPAARGADQPGRSAAGLIVRSDPARVSSAPRRVALLEIAFFRTGDIVARVNKLCIFVGTMAGGYAGGFLGSGFGLMTEIVTSGIGSLIGVYLGWRLAQRIER